MPDLPLGAVLCALAAALLFAVASVAQQRAAAAVPEGGALMQTLLRNPRWWAGVVGDGGGYAMQVVALALGSVLVVQPILVSALIFALPISARYSGRTITTRTWLIALALAGSLACFLIVGDPTAGNTTAALRDWVLPGGLLLALIAVFVGLGLAARESGRRALLLGAASGSLYGLAVALTAHVTTQFEHGLTTVLTGWQLWVLIAAGIAGVYFQQRAFQAGALTASLPAITIGEPLAAAFLGITVLDERLRTSGVGVVVSIAAVAVMLAATLALSRSQATA